MKQLRILTGMHAGVQVNLTPGEHRLGASDEADIFLGDWQGSDAVLTMTESGIVSLRHPDTGSGDGIVVLIQDFVPVPCDGIALCVGDAGVAWPRDMDLLATLWVKPSAPENETSAQSTRRMASVALSCVMLGALLVVGGTLFGMQTSRAAGDAPDAAIFGEHIANALRSADIGGLNVSRKGSAIVVSGMVDNAAADTAARAIFKRLGHDQVVRQYDVAQDDAQEIEESLGMPQVRVTYAGKGVFRVDGTVKSRTEFETALARVRNDMDANVKHIDVAVTESPAPTVPDEAYSAMIAIGDVRYVETPDGTKHLYPSASRHTQSLAAADVRIQ